MKILIAWIAIISLGTGMSIAQSRVLEVSWDKTTVLIFESPIQTVDRGSRHLLSQKDDQALNLLKLKAGAKDLPPTNLHVLTADGKLHGFEVRYSDNPAETTLDYRSKKTDGSGLLNSEMGIYPYGLNGEEFIQLSQNLIDHDHKFLKKIFKYEMHFLLKGIYYQEGLLFFDLWLANNSKIPFEAKAPEFQIRDKKAGKRSSNRLLKINPHFSSHSQGSMVSFLSSQGMVLAFPVFTIAENKKLWISIGEERGDRELKISISGKQLLMAENLPMFHHKPTTHGSGEL